MNFCWAQTDEQKFLAQQNVPSRTFNMGDSRWHRYDGDFFCYESYIEELQLDGPSWTQPIWYRNPCTSLWVGLSDLTLDDLWSQSWPVTSFDDIGLTEFSNQTLLNRFGIFQWSTHPTRKFEKTFDFSKWFPSAMMWYA